MSETRKSYFAVASILGVTAVAVGSLLFTQASRVSAHEVDSSASGREWHRFMGKRQLSDEEIALKKAEFDEQIRSAVEDGSLTVRQQELLDALNEVKSELRESHQKADFEGLSHEEAHELRMERVLEALMEAGVETTVEEIEELKDDMGDLGFSKGHRKMHQGSMHKM